MIEGKNIFMKTAEACDIDDVVKLLNNFGEKGECWPLTLYSEVVFRKKFNETGLWESDSGTMFICEKVSGRVVGQILFFKPTTYMPAYEIAYQIFRAEDRGRGFMSEALKIFAAYLFEIKAVPRLQITCLRGNAASRHIAEKCGFIYEGTLRSSYFHRGEYRDLELFSLTRQEARPLAEILKG